MKGLKAWMEMKIMKEIKEWKDFESQDGNKNYEKIDNLDRNKNYERMRSWIEIKAQIVLKGLIAWGLGVMKGLIGPWIPWKEWKEWKLGFIGSPLVMKDFCSIHGF